jgi:hypothetical protein
MLGVRLAADAANNRLDSVRRLEAATTMLTAQSDTAYVILQRANRRFFELAEDPEQRLRLTAEDLVMARNEVDQALNLAHSLNQVVPDLARVAESESRVAPLGGMSIEIGQQLAAQSAPLRSTAAEGSDTAQFIAGLDQFIADGAARIKAFQDRSLQALDRLVRRTPYDERYNLAFWQLNEQLPIREQISLFLRIARAGWVDQGFQAALPQLAARDGFTEIFTSMVDDAQRLADRSDEQLGAVGDAPQVLRLAALLAENERRDADAVALAEAAVKLGRAQDARFPMARVAATTDLARMRLSADPADPTAAVRAAREAIAAAEPWHFARADVDPARHELIAALLAAGDEATAIAEIVALTGQPVAGPTATNPATADPAAIGLGIAYAQLAVRFLEHRLDRRPPSYAGWIERAVALNPEYPMVQEVRARWALQQKNGRDVVDALQRIEQTAGPSPQFETLVQIARTQLPDDPALRAYVEQRAAATQPTTGPSIGPTTVPAPLPPKDTQ